MACGVAKELPYLRSIHVGMPSATPSAQSDGIPISSENQLQPVMDSKAHAKPQA
jgi:hypothetical protein